MNPACQRVEFARIRPRGTCIFVHSNLLAQSFAFFAAALRQSNQKYSAWRSAMAKSLDGINLVEFDSNLGAAYAAMLLAENGARATKVEPPGGSRGRGTPHFHVLNRSKRALELDLDDRASAGRFKELLRWADVVVTGFTPARLEQVN